MKTTIIPGTIVQNETIVPSRKEQIINYYEKAGRDYYTWSKNYNMHFGYYEKGINPLSRESMLEKLNEQVLQRLHLNDSVPSQIVDMGCGLGASLRYGIHHYPQCEWKGVTIVPWQAEQATLLNNQSSDTKSIQLIIGDYCKTTIPFRIR